MKHIVLILLSISAGAFSSNASASAPLTPGAPLVIPGKVGRFDYMEVDTVNQRLLAAHKGAGSLALLDLKHGKLMPSIAVGAVQGIAVDPSSGTYILGDEEEHKIVFVSARTMAKTGELAVSGPVDAIAFDPKNGMAYADEDDGSALWVVDVKKQSLVATIRLPGVPEFVAYDPETDRIYQNIKNKDLMVVVNPTTNKIESEWSTLPATGPHGLAIDGQTARVFIAGHNGKLVGLDLKSGKKFAEAEIAPGTDQISFDTVSRIIYCASKGFISVIKETDTGLEALGNVPAPTGAHTLSVDSQRHDVWISYADKTHSYLQRFSPRTIQ